MAAFAPNWFTTDDYAEKDRLPLCQTQLSALLATLDIEPRPGVPFHARTVSCDLPDACLTTCFLSCARACRHKEHCVMDGSDDIMLLRPVGGPISIEQSGRTIRIEAGDAALISTSVPWTWDVSAVARLDCLRVPLDAVPGAPASLLGTLPRRVAHDVAAFQLLTHYGGALLQGILPMASRETRRIASCHIRDLLMMLIRTDEPEPLTNRLDLIKRDIERHLNDGALSVETIARRHKVTARTVQKLFEADGTTFSEHVLEQRLGLAWERLRTANGMAHKISDIAYEVGFGDLSYFNRAFRRRFGMTPRQARSKPW